MTKPILGIDLGTTFSLVAVLRGDEPVVLRNAIGEALTPSAVSVDDKGTILVGAAARARAVSHPDRTALSFKRDMGTTRPITIGGKTFTAPELSALVLRSLKEDAEAALGESMDEAVVTVPAYFGDAQRQATRDAGTIAGLKVERIINEPTAAALAYGLHARAREFRAVVLDLGGGTFDVSVLEIIEGVIEIQASAGDTRLGGDDFDEALAQHLWERVARERGGAASPAGVARARLREAAELAKKRLTHAAEARVGLVELPLGDRRVDVELVVPRAEAAAAWAGCLARLEDPIRRALQDARADPESIDEVLLVGGSTRMPCIAQFAARKFGRLPLRTLPPDEAVALGAAVQAALKSRQSAVADMVVTDVAPFTMGIATAPRIGAHQVPGMYTPILERGTVIPASRTKRFSTTGDLQKVIRVEVYQGEHSHCSANTKLGEYEVSVPPKPAGEESVDIRFTYDLNGILEVETTVHSTNEKAALVLERAPGRMTKDEIARARKEMARLKFHPRDALPNATALARAEALHVEVTGDVRTMLAREIAFFRAALEGQEPKTIAAARERLVAVVEQLALSR
jgi:molecular chaperone HscC